MIEDKIIEQQDELIYYGYNYYTESMVGRYISEDINMGYSSIIEFILEHDNMLSNISTQNLVTIFANMSKDSDKIELVQKLVMERFQNGDNLFSGSNIEMDAFGIKSYSWNSFFAKLNKENQNAIRDSINERLDDIEESDPEYYDIIIESNSICTVSNFLNYYDKGILDSKKLESLKNIVGSNSDIIKNFNFGLFQDEIYELGDDFIEHIARYPNLVAKLLILHDNNSELFGAFSKQIKKDMDTVSISEYYDEIEILLRYFSQNYHNLEIKNLDDARIRIISKLCYKRNKQKKHLP